MAVQRVVEIPLSDRAPEVAKTSTCGHYLVSYYLETEKILLSRKKTLPGPDWRWLSARLVMDCYSLSRLNLALPKKLPSICTGLK